MESTQMKDCPFCGEQVLTQAAKCKHCKSDLATGVPAQTPQPAPDPQEAGEECSTCKCKVPPNAKRCPHCNADLKPGCFKNGLLGCLGILLLLGGILLGISAIFSS